MKRDQLSIERQLVLLTSIEMEDSQGELLKTILESRLDWSEVIYQMVTHRTLNMFGYNLKKFNLFNSLEAELKRLINTQWAVYRERNHHYSQQLAQVLEVFAQSNLVLPVLKGNMLANIVYPVMETRIFNDLDFLMKLEDVNQVTSALEGLGYIQGQYDEEKHAIVEATRRQKVLHQMSSHEIQEFLKLSDNPFAPLIELDVNHDILWKGKCPYRVDTRELIARAIPVEINGAKGYMLDYIDNIIQLSCHLYKEATLMLWIVSLRDLKIYKFADLHMYIRKFKDQIDWDLLIERVKAYQLEAIVYYNFHYIEEMFGGIVPRHVVDSLRPENLDYLDEYAIENEQPSTWEYNFFTRLFDVNRIINLQGSQLTGMTRFLEAKFNN
ncbi:nucleotidyltransferase family protein [Paenibacillus sp. SI8]|uniref:nucleotidyltransferase domain-containing protein n=1 Tax=unclassified Paenibacillus TaxID=185978 RepID=UPI0034650351